LGIVTPGRVGEFAKAVTVRDFNPGTSWGTSFGTVVVDRLIDIGVFAVVAIWGLVHIGLPGPYHVMGEVLVFGLFALGFLGVVAFFRFSYYSEPGVRFRKLVREQVGTWVSDGFAVMKLLAKPAVIPMLVYTAAAYVLFFIHFYLIGRAVGSTLSFPLLGWSIAIASLAAILPISISGIGVRDFILIFVFTSWGDTPERALAVSLVYLAVLYVILLVFGLAPLLRGQISLRRAQAVKEELHESR
jgi:glycosyltransferase 2 family protein